MAPPSQELEPPANPGRFSFGLFQQPVELDLGEYRGAVPVELLGEARFPAIGERPYFLSPGPYGFFWFRLHRPDTRTESYGIEASPF